VAAVKIAVAHHTLHGNFGALGMRDVLFVACGGALGALSRYGIGIAAARCLGKSFPRGTLAVNVAGCFVMGIVIQVMLRLESEAGEVVLASSRLQSDFWRQAIAI